MIVPTVELRLGHVPPASASMGQIEEFALTHRGYDDPAHARWAEGLARPDGLSLNELRTCLFMLQRDIKWGGEWTPERLVQARRVL